MEHFFWQWFVIAPVVLWTVIGSLSLVFYIVDQNSSTGRLLRERQAEAEREDAERRNKTIGGSYVERRTEDNR